MSQRMVLVLVLHGLFLVLLGMLVGFPFQQAIVSHAGPELGAVKALRGMTRP